jgi:molybdopterin/thiamine biosynthesis adenylyltransferase
MNSERYARQVLFEPIGRDGQKRLAGSRVAIVGCGALGTIQAALLARAGIGRLRLVDRDYVEESNLQRQLLFDEDDAARCLPKAVAAERKLKRINSDVQAEGVVADASARNTEELVQGFDLILDGTDNFETRFLLNDVSLKLDIPWIYGAVVGSLGVTMTILPGRTACLACVLPSLPKTAQETCDTVGVIGPSVSWTASLQVTEALKILLGQEDSLHGVMLSYDIWKNRLQQIRPERDPQCRACGLKDFAYLRDGTSRSTVLCGRNAVQIRPRETRALDLEKLRKRLEAVGRVRGNEYLLQFRLEPYEMTVFADGRAILKGTDSESVARGLYARYIGS